jgi:hypothetical protein
LNAILSDSFVTGEATQTAIVNNILTPTSGASATDVGSFRSALVQVVSTGTGGTFIFEASNDNINFQAIPVFNQLILTGTPITAAITATATQIGYYFATTFRYVRLRIVSTITGGSIQAFSRFSTSAFAPPVQQVAQATAANLAVTASGTVAVSSITAGTNLIADVGHQYRASATGAGTPLILNCPATPAAQSAKGTAGRLIGFYVMNTNASARWLKIFNVASPTLGTTAAVLDIPIPPSNNPIFINFEGGIGFSTAIVVAITAAKGTTNNGAVTLDDVSGFLVFA